MAIIALMLAIGALGVALGSQYLFGANPCDLCILQRYPYVAIIAFAVLAIGLRHHLVNKHLAILYLLTMLAFLSTSAIAAYHVGVEQGLVDAPESCASKPLQAENLDELKAAILSAPKVSCKDVGASFAGVSMAGWNMIYGIISMLIIRYLWKNRKKTALN